MTAAIVEVQPVIQQLIHPELRFTLDPKSTRREAWAILKHPDEPVWRRTMIVEGDTVEFAARQLYGLVNSFGDLRACDHDCEVTRYRGRLLVCPFCWQERQ